MPIGSVPTVIVIMSTVRHKTTTLN